MTTLLANGPSFIAAASKLTSTTIIAQHEAHINFSQLLFFHHVDSTLTFEHMLLESKVITPLLFSIKR